MIHVGIDLHTRNMAEQMIDMERMKALISRAGSEIASYEQDLSLLPEDQTRFVRLEGQCQLHERMFNDVAAKQVELRLYEQSTMGNGRVFDQARLPGGPGIGGSTTRMGDSRSIFGFHARQKVEVYIHRYDESEQRETLEFSTYRLREPFPEGMRNYQLKNGVYVTVNIRTRPITLQYVLFGVTTIGSLAGWYFLLERFFL